MLFLDDPLFFGFFIVLPYLDSALVVAAGTPLTIGRELHRGHLSLEFCVDEGLAESWVLEVSQNHIALRTVC